MKYTTKPQGKRRARPGRNHCGRQMAFGTTLLAGLVAQAWAQPAPAAGDSTQTVTVTGYRASLDSAAAAKRNDIRISDSIFAEDIGKFSDSNIAESIARIPGVTVTREITGEGLQIQIRGLGSSFTRVLLNGAPVASASTGRTDAQSANREVDLDFLPSELMTKLTVAKSPTASMLEGGVAGVVDMRSARPFDKKGTWGTFTLQGTKAGEADKWGNRGAAMASTIVDNTFGILGGFAWSQNKVKTTGFETIGWTNANLSAAQSSSPTRNSTGGGNWTIPATVPANAGNGLVTGATIDQAFLLANNPGLNNITQLDNALIPRLGRSMVAEGDRDRYNGILSFEFRPNDQLEVYVDGIVGKKSNKFERSDMNWVGRNGSMVPLNMQVDRTDCNGGCVVNKGTFANAQLFLEYRPYTETTDFYSVNPGFAYRLDNKWSVDGQLNLSKSTFHRESPTVLVITPGGSGTTVEFENSANGVPSIRSNLDLNNPANFGWAGGRVNVQEEKREIKTQGGRFNLNWGDKDLAVMGGVAYDDIYRRITSLNNDAAWQNVVCGNQLNAWLPAPNTTNPGGCNGASTPGSAVANYPGYGTGFTAGANPASIAFLGSAIPSANLKNYLRPDSRGFISLDWPKFKQDSNYDYYHQNAPVSTNQTNTAVNPGYIEEKVTSFYVEAAGRVKAMDSYLRYDIGVREVRTEQIFGSLTSTADPRNAAQGLLQGGMYPNVITETLTTTKYNNLLPSGTLAYNLRDDIVLRGSASKTMTRPNPQDLRALGLQFSDPSASQATLTSPDLKPYTSTNFDLGAEWYTGREGYLAGALFRKDIKAFTAAQNTTVPFSALAQYGVTYASLTPQQQAAIDLRGGPNNATVVVTQQVNSDALLKVKGVELTWVQPLSFLPVKGFGFNTNYTRVLQSATNNSGFIATGVPPYTYNLTGYYDIGTFSVRLSQTFTKGSQLTSSPQNGINDANLFGDDYKQLDLATALDLGKLMGWQQSVQLTFDIWNLSKTKQRQYFQFSNATYTLYDPGSTYTLGMRMNF